MDAATVTSDLTEYAALHDLTLGDPRGDLPRPEVYDSGEGSWYAEVRLLAWDTLVPVRLSGAMVRADVFRRGGIGYGPWSRVRVTLGHDRDRTAGSVMWLGDGTEGPCALVRLTDEAAPLVAEAHVRGISAEWDESADHPTEAHGCIEVFEFRDRQASLRAVTLSTDPAYGNGSRVLTVRRMSDSAAAEWVAGLSRQEVAQRVAEMTGGGVGPAAEARAYLQGIDDALAARGRALVAWRESTRGQVPPAVAWAEGVVAQRSRDLMAWARARVAEGTPDTAADTRSDT